MLGTGIENDPGPSDQIIKSTSQDIKPEAKHSLKDAAPNKAVFV